MAANKKTTDTIIIDQIYPLVAASMPKRIGQLKGAINRYFNTPITSSDNKTVTRIVVLHDYAPVDRIYFKKKDEVDFFKAMDIDNNTILKDILPNTYYWNDDELQAAKDPFSLTVLMAIRWLLINRSSDPKFITLCYLYLSFSGKFYSSCHWKWFRIPPKREVMDYVVNYMLSKKFDLIRYGSVWAVVEKLTETWLNAYKDELKGKMTDDRIVYIIHQLFNRIYAFIGKIARPYYEAYEKKLYINKESDDYTTDNFRIAKNNSTVADTLTENAMNYFISNQISLAICMQVAKSPVDPYDIKTILENILNSNDNLKDLRFVINVLIIDYMRNYPEDKEVVGAKFIQHSTSLKPNTKDKDILEMKDTVIKWLNTSERYRNTKTQATKNAYFRAIIAYIAMVINFANKEG